jgi:hypothetical protein
MQRFPIPQNHLPSFMTYRDALRLETLDDVGVIHYRLRPNGTLPCLSQTRYNAWKLVFSFLGGASKGNLFI